MSLKDMSTSRRTDPGEVRGKNVLRKRSSKGLGKTGGDGKWIEFVPAESGALTTAKKEQAKERLRAALRCRYLNENSLTGTMPLELGGLTELTYLCAAASASP